MIRIKCEGGVSHGAQITTTEGQPIGGVTGLTLRMDPADVVRAELEINVGAVDVTAHPLLGLDTVEAAAAAHGFSLVPIAAKQRRSGASPRVSASNTPSLIPPKK